MAEQKILWQTTGTLLTYPRVSPSGGFLLAQLDSIEVRIGTPAVAMPTAYSTAVLDSLDEAIGAAASEGDTAITASGAWLKGRRYLVDVDALGNELLEVESRSSAAGGSGLSLLLTEPLPRDVASGGSVRWWAVSYDLSAAQTDLPGEALALWRGTLDGIQYDWAQAFRIVRRLPISSLTPARLMQKWPAIRTLLSRQDIDGEEVIASTWEDRIIPLLSAHGINEEDVISVDALEPLHALACVLQVSLLNNQIPDTAHDRVLARWVELKEATFSRKDWYDADQEDETPEERPDTPIKVRSGATLVR